MPVVPFFTATLRPGLSTSLIDRMSLFLFTRIAKPHGQVGIAEIDRFLAILRHRQRRNDNINFTCLQRRDQSVKWDVLKPNGAVKILAHRSGHIHAHSRRLAARVQHLKWRVRHLHSHNQFFLFGSERWRQEAEDHEQAGAQFHKALLSSSGRGFQSRRYPLRNCPILFLAFTTEILVLIKSDAGGQRSHDRFQVGRR